MLAPLLGITLAATTFVNAGNAPSTLPFSDAVQAGDTLYLSGNIGQNPGTMTFPADFKDEARQALRNLGLVLHKAGYDYRDVVKVTAFLSDMRDYDAWNSVYREFFTGPNYPARSTVAVSALARGAKIEVEMIAVKSH
ncbi:MAG TPA: RidA family protein [Candidatus Aquilonibacter sp.]|nr:RidA family protein [Candidatus Aquilonibacter sp.]